MQQILFFREFDLPLKEIKTVLDDPALDRNQILRTQRDMLELKMARIRRLISGIDDILKGASGKVDFAIFDQTEIAEMFQTMFDRLPEDLRATAVSEFGSVDNWRHHYLQTVSSEKMQKQYAKVVEWYGGKDNYLSAVRQPVSREVAESCAKRLAAIRKKLISRRDCPVDSFEVKALVGEYAFVLRQLTQIRDERSLMLSEAGSLRRDPIAGATDGEYGAGAAAFLAGAIESFYSE